MAPPPSSCVVGPCNTRHPSPKNDKTWAGKKAPVPPWYSRTPRSKEAKGVGRWGRKGRGWKTPSTLTPLCPPARLQNRLYAVVSACGAQNPNNDKNIPTVCLSGSSWLAVAIVVVVVLVSLLSLLTLPSLSLSLARLLFTMLFISRTNRHLSWGRPGATRARRCPWPVERSGRARGRGERTWPPRCSRRPSMHPPPLPPRQPPLFF